MSRKQCTHTLDEIMAALERKRQERRAKALKQAKSRSVATNAERSLAEGLMREAVPKTAEKIIAAKAAEAVGLLVLMKPLMKRAGTLTVAEQQVMMDTIDQASYLLNEATRVLWEERAKPNTETAVRKNGVHS